MKMHNPNARWITTVRRAFTLVEMVISMSILTLILGVCASVTILSTRAATAGASSESAAGQSEAVRAAMDHITSDLKLANGISARSATSITFTVPDRTGDFSPETITYAWAGANTPLTRQFNGGPVVSIAEKVQTFNLAYLDKTVAAPGPPPPVESPEQELISYASSATNAYSLLATAWPAEWFKPTLPANTLSWKITRLKVRMQRNGSKTGLFTVSIYATNPGKKPVGSPLASGSIDITTVSSSSPQWVDVFFSMPIAGISPSNEMALVVSTNVSPSAGSMIQDHGPPTMSNMGYMTSSDGGSSWSTPATSKAMQYYIYGTITTQP